MSEFYLCQVIFVLPNDNIMTSKHYMRTSDVDKMARFTHETPAYQKAFKLISRCHVTIFAISDTPVAETEELGGTRKCHNLL